MARRFSPKEERQYAERALTEGVPSVAAEISMSESSIYRWMRTHNVRSHGGAEMDSAHSATTAILGDATAKEQHDIASVSDTKHIGHCEIHGYGVPFGCSQDSHEVWCASSEEGSLCQKLLWSDRGNGKKEVMVRCPECSYAMRQGVVDTDSGLCGMCSFDSDDPAAGEQRVHLKDGGTISVTLDENGCVDLLCKAAHKNTPAYERHNLWGDFKFTPAACRALSDIIRTAAQNPDCTIYWESSCDYYSQHYTPDANTTSVDIWSQRPDLETRQLEGIRLNFTRKDESGREYDIQMSADPHMVNELAACLGEYASQAQPPDGTQLETVRFLAGYPKKSVPQDQQQRILSNSAQEFFEKIWERLELQGADWDAPPDRELFAQQGQWNALKRTNNHNNVHSPQLAVLAADIQKWAHEIVSSWASQPAGGLKPVDIPECPAGYLDLKQWPRDITEAATALLFDRRFRQVAAGEQWERG